MQNTFRLMSIGCIKCFQVLTCLMNDKTRGGKKVSEIVCAILMGVLSLVLFVYASFTRRCKGPIFSNTYLFASEEERKNLDIKAEYHLVTVVFTFLATIFAFFAVHIFTGWKWCQYFAFILVGCVLVYAIIKTVKTEKNRK